MQKSSRKTSVKKTVSQESIKIKQDNNKVVKHKNYQKEFNSSIQPVDVHQELDSPLQEDPEINVEISEKRPYSTNMFASVWVKVEVDDESEDAAYILEDGDKDSSFTIPKKKQSISLLKSDNYPFNESISCDVSLSRSPPKNFSCTLCDFSSKCRTALKKHILSRHHLSLSNRQTIPVYKCTQCEYTTYYKWNLNAHKRKHLDKQFKCNSPNCDYETAYKNNLLQHAKKHNGTGVYKCDKCPFVTKFEGHINRHLVKIHNEVTDNMLKCNLCSFSSKDKKRLDTHRQRSRQANVLKCNYCKFESYFMCESRKHKLTHFTEICINQPVPNTESSFEEKQKDRIRAECESDIKAPI